MLNARTVITIVAFIFVCSIGNIIYAAMIHIHLKVQKSYSYKSILGACMNARVRWFVLNTDK